MISHYLEGLCSALALHPCETKEAFKFPSENSCWGVDGEKIA